MNCCFTACELWKLARRGYVPMDVYNAQSFSRGCGCGSCFEEASYGCGCGENNYFGIGLSNNCNCD